MSIDKSLLKRANEQCECCNATEKLVVYELPASATSGLEAQLLLCEQCISEADAEARDHNHWLCLYYSMSSEVTAIEVVDLHMLYGL